MCRQNLIKIGRAFVIWSLAPAEKNKLKAWALNFTHSPLVVW